MVAIAAVVTERSRRKAFSTNVSIMRSSRNAALRQTQTANVSMAVIVLEFDRPRGVGIAAAYFCRQELKPFVQIDASAVLLAGDRIANRLAACAHDAFDLDLRC